MPSEPSPLGREVLLVLLEFTGLGSDYSFARALPDRPRGRTLTVDPLSIELDYDTSLPHRAALIADQVLVTGANQVVLAASCSGALLLAPLADALVQSHVDVATVAAVDAGPITREILARTIKRIGDGLGCTAADDGGVWGEHQGALTLEAAEWLVQGWMEEYIAREQFSTKIQNIYRKDILGRYMKWINFLFSACDAVWAGPQCDAHVFTVRPEADLTGVFGPGARVERRIYAYDGRPGLARRDLGYDLRKLLAAYRWPESTSQVDSKQGSI
jgi:hypothetical protein